MWGIAVTLAVFLTRHICYAHLNPAVSVAMVVAGRMKARMLPGYFLAQLAGGIMAGAMLYILFGPSIAQYELTHDIVRGTAASVDTARMFGEFYPNPGDAISTVSLPLAMLAEGFGTMMLVLFIFGLTEDCNVGKPSSDLQPLFIVNARVETTPEHLNDIVKDVLATAIDDQYDNEILAWRFLQPGRPNPTHRII